MGCCVALEESVTQYREAQGFHTAGWAALALAGTPPVARLLRVLPYQLQAVAEHVLTRVATAMDVSLDVIIPPSHKECTAEQFPGGSCSGRVRTHACPGIGLLGRLYV